MILQNNVFDIKRTLKNYRGKGEKTNRSKSNHIKTIRTTWPRITSVITIRYKLFPIDYYKNEKYQQQEYESNFAGVSDLYGTQSCLTAYFKNYKYRSQSKNLNK